MQATAHKPHIWAAVEVFSEWFLEETYPGKPIPEENRGSWFCPCVTIYDAEQTHNLLTDIGISKVVDLGAGDLRFSLYMDRLGYDVIAYESMGDLVEAVENRFDLGNIDLVWGDYYRDYDDLVGPNTAVCAFGDTNKLPYIPDEGVALQGYFETGVQVYMNGETLGDSWRDIDSSKEDTGEAHEQ